MVEYYAYLEECNNETAYNEAIDHIPTKIVLGPRAASEAHSLAHVLKDNKKRIELLMIGGDYVLPLYTAISFMPGSVSFVNLQNSFYNLNV